MTSNPSSNNQLTASHNTQPINNTTGNIAMTTKMTMNTMSEIGPIGSFTDLFCFSIIPLSTHNSSMFINVDQMNDGGVRYGVICW